jgi:hypothetical protein
MVCVYIMNFIERGVWIILGYSIVCVCVEYGFYRVYGVWSVEFVLLLWSIAYGVCIF